MTEHNAELIHAAEAVRDRLLAFVGAVADMTDCGPDVDAITRLDAALARAKAAPSSDALASALEPFAKAAEARALAAEAEVKAVLAAIPGLRFMDPPDGGDPKPHEQVQRMADALKDAEAEVSRLTAEREKDREALDEANARVIAFGALAAIKYAHEAGFPDDHLHPAHYDALAKAGARMDDFTRARLEDTHD